MCIRDSNKAGEQFTGGKLSDVRAGPTREIEEITDLIEDAAGGSTSVKSGFESIQDAGTLEIQTVRNNVCLLYTSPSPRDS